MESKKKSSNLIKGKREPFDSNYWGLVWFYDRIHGKSFRQMAEEYDKDTTTIKKYVRRTGDMLADAGKEKIMSELMPLAIKVYKARLEYELKEYEAGRVPDVQHADRLFKGMFILDHKTQEKDQEVQKKLEEGEVQTLDELMMKRTRITKPKDQKQLPTVEVIDAESNNQEADHQE